MFNTQRTSMEEGSRRHQQLESVHFPADAMESVLATVSGYHGSQKFNLIRLISRAGASYVGNMNPSVTHLVCWRFEGRKYELAKKLKMVIVNHRWVEECVKKGRRVSERLYTFQCGEDVGPLSLDIPSELNLPKSQSKALKNSKRNVIDIDSEDTNNAAMMDALLFDELEEACPSQPVYYGRSKKRNSTSLKPQGKGRRLVKKHISTKDGLSTSNTVEDCQGIPPLTETNNGCVVLSDSSDVERHRPISNSHTSDQRSFLSEQDISNGVEEIIKHVNDEKCNASEDACLDSTDQCERLPAPSQLSCVICWTEFSSNRGVLPCGHRFCFKCIQEWSDHMRASGKPSTCPLCKASFICITRIDAASSDQKIYSQSIPHNSLNTDLYILPDEIRAPYCPPSNASPQVCCLCFSREPVDLLVICDVCKTRCVHCYCLDPPLFPWTCVHCQDLQGLRPIYNRIR